MNEICYLCGKSIESHEINSDDHAVPRQLIKRKQPKAKGFDYGGYLPTHEKCNNEFGPQSYCTKSLKLLSVLHDPKCFLEVQNKKDPSITALTLNHDCMKEFTRKDLEFFKIIDVREKSITEFSKPDFFKDKPKSNPIRDAVFVALAVLTKSAAALLVSRHLKEVPRRWSVLAIPYSGATESLDFDELLGKIEPFDIGVKVRLRSFRSGDWFALYRAYNVLVFFLFRFSSSYAVWNGMLSKFRDAAPLSFEGDYLNEVIGYQWKSVCVEWATASV